MIPIESKSGLIQVMLWHRAGDKPLPAPMVTEFYDTTWLHENNSLALVSQKFSLLNVI